MLVTIQNARPVGGTITAPPSKSMAHRAVLCAALAKGTSHIGNLEFSKDISATLSAAGQLCAKVRTGPDSAVVEGLGRFLPVEAPVDCCESGSTLRFLIPLASLTGQEVTFTGRGRLMERPQSVYETLYHEQSLRFEPSPAGLTVEGALKSGEYKLAGMYNSYGNNRNTIDRGRNESLAALLDTLNSNRSSALQSYNSQLSAAEQQKMAYQMQLEQALANGSAEILQNKYDTLQNLDNAYAQQILALQQAAAQAAQKRW